MATDRDPDEEMMRAFFAGELVADRETIERCAEIAARDLFAAFRARYASSAPAIAPKMPRDEIRPRARRDLGRGDRP